MTTKLAPRAKTGWGWAAVAAAAWLALYPITSVDAYYHLATGRRILDERAIPARGVGSASFGQAPWHDNEWGFQVLAALLGRSTRDASGVLDLTPAGRAALIVLRAATLAATLTLLLRTMVRLDVGPGLAALGVWLAAFLTFGNLFWDIRPQILSYLAIAGVFHLLERSRGGARWALPASLVVIALWSNVHGAVILGIAALAGEASGAWIERLRGTVESAEARRLTASALLAPAAACLNPLGWHQLVYPLNYAAHPEIFAGNNEWTRPDLLHLPLLMLCAALLALAVAAGARPRPRHALRLALFAGLFLTAIRHLPFLVIAGVPIGAAALTEAARRGGWRHLLDPFSAGERSRVRRVSLGLALAASVAALSGARFISIVPRIAEAPSRPLPEAEVRFLASKGVAGAGFNAYRAGGFLMFRMYPAELVVIDVRNDLYGSFRVDVYNRILTTAPGWRDSWTALVDRVGIGWVLLDASDPLAAALATEPGWKRIPPERFVSSAQPSGDAFALYVADTPANRQSLY